MIRTILFLLVSFLIALPVYAAESDVLEKLENYIPPDMFGSGNAPDKNSAPADIKPPIPPRRPTVFHASESFIEKARKDIRDNPDGHRPSPVFTNKTEDMSENLELTDPTVQDILEQLEAFEARRPAPKKAKPSVPQVKKPEKPAGASNEDVISLGYQPGITELPEDMKERLLKQIAAQKQTKPGMRIEVRAYATPFGEDPGSARKISLARALAIRTLLVEKQIDSKDLTIRPMGHQPRSEPPDRVDIVFASGGK